MSGQGGADRAARPVFPLAPVHRPEGRDKLEKLARMDAADVGLEPQRLGDAERLRVMSGEPIGEDAQLQGLRRRDERLTRGRLGAIGVHSGSVSLLRRLLAACGDPDRAHFAQN